MRYGRRTALATAILLALFGAACNSGRSFNSTNPPPGTVGVTISPTSSSVGFGATQQFTATVTGTTNNAVTWTVSGSSSSSSTQIGSISSSGLYTAPMATTLSAASPPQLVTVNPGSNVQNTDITVPALNSVDSITVTATSQADNTKSASATVTLTGISILAVGQCTQTTATQLSCSAGSTGTEVSQGQTFYIFIAGNGILPGTSYDISSNGGDVTIPLQPTSAGGNFSTTTTGIPVVFFQVVVSPTATLGPRNLVVTNTGNELTSFVGAVDITQ
ncbi:MAG TPA: hypothetical protein VNM47_17590 [Terriglobia bacterium]|nr:hypothetical protein [Terriglobia bacterium]